MSSIRRIAVATDGSAVADKAVRFAADLADDLKVPLTVLTVANLTSAEAMGMRESTREEVQAALDSDAKPAFDTARRVLGDRPMEGIRLVGDPATEILGWAKMNQVDLLVIGSRGLGPVRELVLGSVSEKVAHGAPCPVTIVR